MIHAFIRYSDGSLVTVCNSDTLDRAKADKGSRFWVDLDQPTDEELKLLSDVFQFHPLAVEDAAGQHAQRSKIEPYYAENGGVDRAEEERPAYYFMVFHGPDLEVHDHLQTKELDVFMSEQYLVTVHRKRMLSIENTIKRVKPNPRASLNDEGLDLLLHSILDQIVDAYFPILDSLQAKIDKLEDLATDTPQRMVLRRINRMKRELLSFRRTIAPQRDVLNSLTRGEVPFIDEKARIYLRDVQDHLNRVVETVELFRDLVSGARDVYLSSLSNNLNQVMKTLTIITVIALPLTVITSFFGMNFDAIPGLHSVRAFWITVVVMAAAVGGLLTLFYKKRWI